MSGSEPAIGPEMRMASGQAGDGGRASQLRRRLRLPSVEANSGVTFMKIAISEFEPAPLAQKSRLRRWSIAPMSDSYVAGDDLAHEARAGRDAHGQGRPGVPQEVDAEWPVGRSQLGHDAGHHGDARRIPP